MARFEPLDVIELTSAIDAFETETEVVNRFSEFIQKFGFGSVALGYLVNPLAVSTGNNFQVTNWPKEWFGRWQGGDYIIHDPIARYALRTRRSFDWKTAYEHGSKIGRVILDESRNFGFTEGFAIPIHSFDGPPGCVSLGGRNVDLSPKEKACIELVSVHVYSRLEALSGPRPMREIVDLTRRETEVLQYAAAGKTNWEISRILSLSENTVIDYVKSAMRKLGSVNRTHAIALAIQNALILP